MKRSSANQQEIKTNKFLKPETDLFSDLCEQESIKCIKDFEKSSSGAITKAGPIIFNIEANPKYFTDLTNTYLRVKLRVTKNGGQSLVKEDKGQMTVTNDFFNSLFSRIKLELNDVSCNANTTTHPTATLVKYLTSCNQFYRENILRHSNVWYKDFGGNDLSVIERVRHVFIEESRQLTLVGRLTPDAFGCKRLLLPNIRITIILDRTDPQFSIYRTRGSKDTYEIEISECTIIMRHVELLNSALNHIQTRLNAGAMAVMPFFKTETRCFTVPQGQLTWRVNNIFNGKLPTRCLFMLTDTTTISGGSFDRNAGVFPGKVAGKYNLNFVDFYVNQDSILTKPYTPDFDNGDYIESFLGLTKTLRALNSDQWFPLSCKEWGTDYSIFGADLTADKTNFNSTSEGTVSLQVQFKDVTTEAVSGILIGEFRSAIKIDKHNNVSVIDV